MYVTKKLDLICIKSSIKLYIILYCSIIKWWMVNKTRHECLFLDNSIDISWHWKITQSKNAIMSIPHIDLQHCRRRCRQWSNTTRNIKGINVNGINSMARPVIVVFIIPQYIFSWRTALGGSLPTCIPCEANWCGLSQEMCSSVNIPSHRRKNPLALPLVCPIFPTVSKTTINEPGQF